MVSSPSAATNAHLHQFHTISTGRGHFKTGIQKKVRDHPKFPKTWIRCYEILDEAPLAHRPAYVLKHNLFQGLTISVCRGVKQHISGHLREQQGRVNIPNERS